MAKKIKDVPTAGLSDDKYSEWKVESAYRTLKEAETIKQDAKMMKLIGEHHETDKKSVKSLDDLRSRINDDLEEKNEDSKEE